MTITCTNYDEYIVQWQAEIYRFCLMLVLDATTAEEMTFQAYLRLGLAQPGMDKSSAHKALYAAAFAVSKAYYLKKLRRRPTKSALRDVLSADDAASLGTYLRLPFICRASAFLLHITSFPPEVVGEIVGVRSSRAAYLGNVPDMDNVATACFALRRSGEAQSDLSDRLYMRFSERNVSFEIRMLDMRHKFDRIVPYLALVILVVFACAFFFY